MFLKVVEGGPFFGHLLSFFRLGGLKFHLLWLFFVHGLCHIMQVGFFFKLRSLDEHVVDRDELGHILIVIEEAFESGSVVLAIEVDVVVKKFLFYHACK